MAGRWRRWAKGLLLAVFVFGCMAALMAACGSDKPPGISEGTYTPPNFGCSDGTNGCPCSVAGQTTACGELVATNGNYVTCSQGKSTCDGSKWGPCVGNKIVVQSITGKSLVADGLRFQSTAVACPNVCDPNGCQAFQGQPDADVPETNGVSVTDAGVVLSPVEAGTGGSVSGNGPCVGLGCQVSTCGCRDTADCPAGQSCCLGAPYASSGSFCSTVKGCGVGQLQLCASNADCNSPALLSSGVCVAGSSNLAGVGSICENYCTAGISVLGLLSLPTGGKPPVSPPPTCGSVVPTQINGVVYDPAGKNPLAGVTVWIPQDPTGKLPPEPTGTTCQQCTASPPNAVAWTVTGADGSFSLTTVPVGNHIPIVTELGKWRRELQLNTINSCSNNSVVGNCTCPNPDQCQFRLPKNQFDGYNPLDGTCDHADMPHMAVVSGTDDPFECVLLKAGIDPWEIGDDTYHNNTSALKDLPDGGVTLADGGAAPAGTKPDKHLHYYVSPTQIDRNFFGIDFSLLNPSQSTASSFNTAGLANISNVTRKLDPAYGNGNGCANAWNDPTCADALWLSGYPDPTPLTPTPPHYDYYDAVYMGCEGAHYDKELEFKGPSAIPAVNGSNPSFTGPAHGGTEPYGNMINFVNSGGRLFATHFGYTWMRDPSLYNYVPTAATGQWPSLDNWSNVANWRGTPNATPTWQSGFGFCLALNLGTPLFVFDLALVPFFNFGFSLPSGYWSNAWQPPGTNCLAHTGFQIIGFYFGDVRTNAFDNYPEASPITATVCQGTATGTCSGLAFPKGVEYAQWLYDNGSSATQGQIDLTNAYRDLSTVGPHSTSWLTADPANYYTPHFTFNAPYNASPANQCGRAVYSDFHANDDALVGYWDIQFFGWTFNSSTAGSCWTNEDCGFTQTCQGAVLANGICREPCRTNADCKDTSYTCPSTAGTCGSIPCQPQYKTSCTEGTCDPIGATQCLCTDDSMCDSHKCVNSQGVCTGTCTGTGSTYGTDSCMPVATVTCTSNVSATCTVGTCNTATTSFYSSIDTGCWCTADSQCPSHKCVPVAAQNAAACGSAGPCTGVATSSPSNLDAMNCVSLDSQLQACVQQTVYVCNLGACSTPSAPGGQCLCSNDAMCPSGRHCINTGQCTAGPCTGHAPGDTFGCDTAPPPIVEPPDPNACKATSVPACPGTEVCNSATNVCQCTADSQCPSGKCIDQGQGCTSCTGTGTADSASCQPDIPLTCTANNIYSCAMQGQTAVCKANHVTCACTADAQCTSGKCVLVAGENDSGTVAGGCTAGTCHGTGTPDANDCQSNFATSCTPPGNCPRGGCNAAGGACSSGGLPCVCTQDGDCGAGGKCGFVTTAAGTAQHPANSTVCGNATTCSGGSTLANLDGFDCLVGSGPDVNKNPNPTCATGFQPSLSVADQCVCTKDSACGTGKCVALVGQNEVACGCPSGTSCTTGTCSGVNTGAGSYDPFGCTVPVSASATYCTKGACKHGCTVHDDGICWCNTINDPCVCTQNSDCSGIGTNSKGSGLCLNSSACPVPGNCTGAAPVDDFDCQLTPNGIPAAATPNTSYSCTLPLVCDSAGTHACQCTNDNQCSSGKCVPNAINTAACGANCTGTGTSVDYASCQVVNPTSTSASCANGAPNAAASACDCTDNTSATNGCKGGKCNGHVADYVSSVGPVCSGTCTGATTPDSFNCQENVAGEIPTSCSSSSVSSCVTSLLPVPVVNSPTNTLCLCVDNSDCASGTCVNANGQCTGTCVATTGVTWDSTDCQIIKSSQIGSVCAHGGCNDAAGGTCSAAGHPCVCTKDADCTVNSVAGKCGYVTAGDSTHSVNSTACGNATTCSASYTSLSQLDGFDCLLSGQTGASSAEVSVPYCGTGPSSLLGIPSLSVATACVANQDAQCGSGKCVASGSSTTGNGNAPGCSITQATPATSGGHAADAYACWEPVSTGGTYTCPSGACNTSTGKCTATGKDCLCSSDSACGTGGKCKLVSSGANANNSACKNSATRCSGSGTIDGFNCQVGLGLASFPTPTCSPGMASLSVADVCVATLDAQCSSGQCVRSGSVSTGNGNAAGCSVASGSGTPDAEYCLEPVSAAGGYSCPTGACDASGGTCASGNSCYCTADAECTLYGGGKCVATAGQNEIACGCASGVACTTANCTGSSLAAHDGFGCTFATGLTSLATPTCSSGMASLTVANACVCNADSQCPAGQGCVKFAANSNCTSGGPCTGATGTQDSFGCATEKDTTSITTYACAKGGCNAAGGVCASGTGNCYCYNDNQCPGGASFPTTHGLCKSVSGQNNLSCAGAGGSCTGGASAAVDDFNCVLAAPGIPATPQVGSQTCSPGTCNGTNCLCTADSQCSSTKCTKVSDGSSLDNSAGCGASNCTGDPTKSKDYANCEILPATPATYACLGGGAPNTGNTQCWCSADNSTSPNGCKGGSCDSSNTCSGCSGGASAADSFNCKDTVAGELQGTSVVTTNHYTCPTLSSFTTNPAPNGADTLCLCTGNSDCSSGTCVNSFGQCTGVGGDACAGSGTTDSQSCLVISTDTATGYKCAVGGCNALHSSTSCAQNAHCTCTQDSDCGTGGKCGYISSAADATHFVNSAACTANGSSSCTGCGANNAACTTQAQQDTLDGFGCLLGSGTTVSAPPTCGTGVASKSNTAPYVYDSCQATAAASCASGACVQSSGNGTAAGCSASGTSDLVSCTMTTSSAAAWQCSGGTVPGACNAAGGCSTSGQQCYCTTDTDCGTGGKCKNSSACPVAGNCTGSGSVDSFNCQVGQGSSEVSAPPTCASGTTSQSNTAPYVYDSCQATGTSVCPSGACVRTAANGNAAGCSAAGTPDLVSCAMVSSTAPAWKCSATVNGACNLASGLCTASGQQCYCTTDTDCGTGGKCLNSSACPVAGNCTGAAPVDSFNCQIGKGSTEVSTPPATPCATGTYSRSNTAPYLFADCAATLPAQCSSGACVQTAENATAAGCSASGTPDMVSCAMTTSTGAGATGCAKGGCNDAYGGKCSASGHSCYCKADSDCPGSGAKCVPVAGQNDTACGTGSNPSNCSGSGTNYDAFHCQLAQGTEVGVTCPATFGYVPSNFTATSYTAPAADTTDCNATYNSTSHSFTVGSCTGQAPTINSNVAQTPTAGPVVDILVFRNFTLAAGSTLTLTGNNPVILAVYGNANIAGTISAAASGATAGPGGNNAGGNNSAYCTPGAAPSGGSPATVRGGGGGARAAAGGTGAGNAAPGTSTGGTASGSSSATPLVGGCAGVAGEAGAAAGAGGGGVQISAAGTVTVTGTINVSGGVGANGGAGLSPGGGAGGGSGGDILLEGTNSISGGTLTAAGQSGGNGGECQSAPAGQQGGGSACPCTGAGGAGGAAGAAGSAGVRGSGVNSNPGSPNNTCNPTGTFWTYYAGGGGGGSGGYVVTNSNKTATTCTGGNGVCNAARTGCTCTAGTQCGEGTCGATADSVGCQTPASSTAAATLGCTKGGCNDSAGGVCSASAHACVCTKDADCGGGGKCGYIVTAADSYHKANSVACGSSTSCTGCGSGVTCTTAAQQDTLDGFGCLLGSGTEVSAAWTCTTGTVSTTTADTCACSANSQCGSGTCGNGLGNGVDTYGCGIRNDVTGGGGTTGCNGAGGCNDVSGGNCTASGHSCVCTKDTDCGAGGKCGNIVTALDAYHKANSVACTGNSCTACGAGNTQCNTLALQDGLDGFGCLLGSGTTVSAPWTCAHGTPSTTTADACVCSANGQCGSGTCGNGLGNGVDAYGCGIRNDVSGGAGDGCAKGGCNDVAGGNCSASGHACVCTKDADCGTGGKCGYITSAADAYHKPNSTACGSAATCTGCGSGVTCTTAAQQDTLDGMGCLLGSGTTISAPWACGTNSEPSATAADTCVAKTDSVCSSGKCVSTSANNSGGNTNTCSGTDSADLVSCDLPVAGTSAAWSCNGHGGCNTAGGACTSGAQGCYCYNDSQCKSGKCAYVTSGASANSTACAAAGNCNGGVDPGAAGRDGFDCVIMTNPAPPASATAYGIPSAPTNNPTYACAVGVPNAGDTACVCKQNSDCSSGKCVNVANQCTGTCDASGSTDSAYCEIITPTVATYSCSGVSAIYGCAKGGCNDAFGGGCTAAGHACVCTQDSDCPGSGALCVSSAANSVACGATRCHGSGAADGFGCQLGAGNEVSASESCVSGTPSRSTTAPYAAATCVANVNSACGTGTAISSAANNSCGGAGPCGSGTSDSVSCLTGLTSSASSYACPEGNCVGGCTAAGQACVCKQDSDCPSGKCKSSTACTGSCTGSGSTDGFNCTLASPTISATETTTTTYPCAKGACNVAGGVCTAAGQQCVCTRDTDCGVSGKCVNNNACSGSCSGTGPADSFGCQIPSGLAASCTPGISWVCGAVACTRGSCTGSGCTAGTCVCGAGTDCNSGSCNAGGTLDSAKCSQITSTTSTGYSCSPGTCSAGTCSSGSPCFCSNDNQCGGGRCYSNSAGGANNSAACTASGACGGNGSADSVDCQAPTSLGVFACSKGGCNDVATGLVAYYPFEGNANDLSGNGNNATAANVTYSTGKQGQGVTINTGGSIVASGATTLGTLKTLCAWIKPAAGTTGLGQPVFVLGSTGAANSYDIAAASSPSAGGCGTSGVFLDKWGASCYTTTLSATTSSWNFVCFSETGADTTFFVNGTSQMYPREGQFSAALSALGIGTNGTSGSSTTATLFGGQIDEVTVWSTSLTPGQMNSLYTSTILDGTPDGWCNGAGTACVCTQDSDCGTGKCVKVSGHNDVACGTGTVRCSGTGTSYDGFYCQLGTGTEPSAAATCTTGTPSSTAANTCLCSAGSQCGTGTCGGSTKDSNGCLSGLTSSSAGANGSTTCLCTADGQCKGGQCAQWSGCAAGACSGPAADFGTALVDGFNCVIATTNNSELAASCSTTYTCSTTLNPQPIPNAYTAPAAPTACLCVNDSDCGSGKCVPVANQNAAACGANCSGSGTMDAANCQLITPTSGTQLACAKGGCNVSGGGNATGGPYCSMSGLQCYCYNDNQCPTGQKCVNDTTNNNNSCTGAGGSCTGVYSALVPRDGFNCTVPTPTCPANETPGRTTINACVAAAPAACQSSTCKQTADNNNAGACTSTATAGDTISCLVATASSTGSNVCSAGHCNDSASGKCTAASHACVCTNDNQCKSGSKCVSVSSGALANSTACGVNCTGTGAHDGFDCTLGGGTEVAATPACSAGYTPSYTTANKCLCSSDGVCTSGKCVADTAGSGNNNCAGGGTTSCTGVADGVNGTEDTTSCMDPLSGGGFGCPSGSCDSYFGSCTSSGAGCYCGDDSDCLTGSKCVSVSGQNEKPCTFASCTGSGAHDGFNCTLVSGVTIPTIDSCTVGTPNQSVPNACAAMADNQCGSGSCVHSAGAGNTGGTCSLSSGTTDNEACVENLSTGTFTCALGGCNGAGGTCSAANVTCYCDADSQCKSGVCAKVAGQNDVSCGSACSGGPYGANPGYPTVDGFNCMIGSPGIPALTTLTTYSCSIGVCNTGHTACLCTADTQCSSGRCVNSGQCTGTCTGNGSADQAGCEIVPPVAGGYACLSFGYSCSAGGCNTSGGACSGANQSCYCYNDSQCLSGKCLNDGVHNNASCTGPGGSCTAPAGSVTNGFNCLLASPGMPSYCGFGYTPSNFTPASYTPPTGATTDCNATYSSSSHNFTGSCTGATPTIVPGVSQGAGNPVVDILVFKTLTIASGSTLRLLGSNPVILAVYGDATINGTIDATASGTTPGAGGNSATSCASANNGQTPGSGGGGGGGGLAVAGANGGNGASGGGSGGTSHGAATAVPLIGGCAGGTGGGAGGGAVQISAAGTLSGSGTIKTNGGNGGAGSGGSAALLCLLGGSNGGGGGGGGSAGDILLEGQSVAHGTLAANGGTGGNGGKVSNGGASGGGAGSGGTNNGTSTTAPTAGGAGTAACSTTSGGGGGGGAYGSIQINAHAANGPACSASTSLSPAPVCNSTHTGCLCAADADCASGKCVPLSPTSQCTGSCTGSGAADAQQCQLLMDSPSAAPTSQSATAPCWCTTDAVCKGSKCVNWSGCQAGKCTATTGSTPTDSLNCLVSSSGTVLGSEIPNVCASVTSYSCSSGAAGTTTLLPAPVPVSVTTGGACLCVADSDCPSGKCYNGAGQCTAANNGTGASLCTGSNTAPNVVDAADCQQINSTSGYTCSQGGCNTANASCSAASQPCVCTRNSDCTSGAGCDYVTTGATPNSAACGNATTCSGNSPPDGFDCDPAKPTCGVGTPSLSTANACVCQHDTDCDSGKCIPSAANGNCAGTGQGPCNGSGTPDAFGCQMVTSPQLYTCTTTLTPSPVCNIAHSACICSNDADCGSGGCVKVADNTAACGASGCTGTGAADSTGCAARTSTGAAGTYTCTTTLTPTPIPASQATGAACVCVADADCPSGKCVNVASQCTGACTGSGTADQAYCQQIVSSGSTSFSCATGTPNGAGTQCLCTADSQCNSGLCSNANSQCSPASNCSGSTGAGTYDSSDCQIVDSAPYVCPKGNCSTVTSPGAQCTAAGATCWCTNDNQCSDGQKCVSWAGCTAGACTGAGATDGFHCAAASPTSCAQYGSFLCLQSGTTSNCGSNFSCSTGCGTGTCSCSSGSACGSGVCGGGSTDALGCGLIKSVAGAYCSKGNCSDVSSPSGHCTGSSAACWCTADNQCPAGQACAQWAGCPSGACSAASNSTTDSFHCVAAGGAGTSCGASLLCLLNGNSCSWGSCSGSCGSCTCGGNNALCGSGICGGANQDSYGCGTLAPTTTATACQSGTCDTATASSGAASACGGSATPCWCTADTQCKSGKCLNWAGCAAGACTGSGAADGENCTTGASGLPLVPTGTGHYTCPKGNCDNVSSSSGLCAASGVPCWCTSNAQCNSGQCVTWAGCSATGTGTSQCYANSGQTLDDFHCALAANGIPAADTTNPATYACAKGGCNAAGGACTASGAGCYCFKDSQCPNGGKCVNDGTNNNLSCTGAGGSCTGSGAHDAFNCQVGAPDIPTSCTVSSAQACPVGTCTATGCVCTADTQCDSGHCFKVAGVNDGAGQCTGATCTGSGGACPGPGCDAAFCQPMGCSNTPTYSCAVGTCNGTAAGNTACVCTADSQCDSGKCIAVVGQNEVACGCPSGTSCVNHACTGTGTPDTNNCVPNSCATNPTVYTCPNNSGKTVTCSPNHTACWCTDDSQCDSGHCDDQGQCAAAGGHCTGTDPLPPSRADSCMAPDTETCHSSTNYTCPVEGVCNTSNLQCVCNNDNQCDSGKCVKFSANTAACGSNCTGTGSPAIDGCMPFTGGTCTVTNNYTCSPGTCSGDHSHCVCESDAECNARAAGSLCVKQVGVNDGTGQCTSASCTGTGGGGPIDNFSCESALPKCTTATGYACTSGTCDPTNTWCICTSDVQCPTNKCVDKGNCVSGACTGNPANPTDNANCEKPTGGSTCYQDQDCVTGGNLSRAVEACQGSHQMASCTKSCTSNSQCTGGETCTGDCLGAQCAPTRQCQAGETCTSALCVGKSCSTTADCTSGETCVSGQCHGAATCQNDGQCQAGEVCTGVCRGGPCGSNSDCSSPETCVGGYCHGSVCTCENGETCTCTGGEVCTNGTCRGDWCTSSSTCAAGETCSAPYCQGCQANTQCSDKAFAATCSSTKPNKTGKCTWPKNPPNAPYPAAPNAPDTTHQGLDSAHFPEACIQRPMTPQEKALEYMFFDLTACVTPDTQPSGSGTTLVPETFNLDFTATCPQGTRVRWTEWDWQASFPNPANGSSIVFAAQTAPAGATDSQYVPSAPLQFEKANTNTTLPNYDVALLDTSPGGTGAFTTASPPLTSQAELRIWVTLNPTTDGTQSPTLIGWRVQYDCPPSE